MQIETTIRYHLIPDRMTIIQKAKDSKCGQGCEEKGTLPVHGSWECKLGWTRDTLNNNQVNKLIKSSDFSQPFWFLKPKNPKWNKRN